jgi:hypothetical protein
MLPPSAPTEISLSYLSNCEVINANISTAIQLFGDNVATSLEHLLQNITEDGMIPNFVNSPTTKAWPKNASSCQSSQVALLLSPPEMLDRVRALVSVLDYDQVCTAWGGILHTGLCQHTFQGMYMMWISSLVVMMGFVLLIACMCVMSDCCSSTGDERRNNMIHQARQAEEEQAAGAFSGTEHGNICRDHAIGGDPLNEELAVSPGHDGSIELGDRDKGASVATADNIV